MKRLCIFLVLLASACAYGQVGPIAITSAECATIGVGAKVSVITFQVTGTWTGTLQPKITVQGQAAANVQVTPSTSSTAASTVTANGIYTAQVNGADTFQVCGNTVASGTANVFLNVSVASKGGGSSSSSGAVSSVFTRTGAVVATTGDYAVAQVTGAAPLASPTFTGTPAAPTAAGGTSTTQLATTAFVAAAIQGVNPAVAVQAATTAVLPNSPTYSNGASGIGATLTAGSAAALVVDGYTPVLNDRILVKTQASSFQNGVYFLSTLGTGVIPYVLTRALDFDQPSDMNNTGAIPVLNGTVNAVTQWVISSSVTTVGTDAVTFTQFSSNPATSSGAVVQLETHTAASSASLSFTTCLGTVGYSMYLVRAENILPQNSANLLLQFSTNGGSTYDSSAIYDYSSFRTNSGGTAVSGNSSQTTMEFDIGGATATTANYGINGTWYITPGGASAYTRVVSNGISLEDTAPALNTGFMHGVYRSNTATNAFRITFTSGNIVSGRMTCYGMTP